jgi:hypothetical protein
MYSITVKINTNDIDRLISAKNPSYKQSIQSAFSDVTNKLSLLQSTVSMIQSKKNTTITEMQ